MKPNHNTKTTLAFLLVAAAGVAPLSAQDADSPAALREQIRELDQKIRILERNQELKEESAASAAKNAAASAKKAPVVSLSEKGFSVATTDKAYSLKIGALVQADGRFYLDDGAPSRDTFILRRVRLPINGTFSKIFNFNITPEFAQADATTANNNTQLVDAWVDARFSSVFGIKAGKFRSPVALEGPDNRHFIEASYTNQLAPNRDIGIESFGAFADKLVSYRLGLYNGAPNNTWASTRNLGDGDFTVGGRLTLAPFVKSDNKTLSGLEFSVGGSFGNEDGANGGIRSNGQQTIVNSYTGDGHHIRVNPAIEWYTGPFSLAAEFSWEQQEIAGGNTLDNFGWRVSAGWVLTGENSGKRGVTPAAPFSWENGTWGAFEIVARLSGLDVGNDLFTTHGGPLDPLQNASSAFSYGVGINWYLNSNLQVRFDVEKSNFGGGSGKGIIAKNELYAFTRVQLTF